MRSDTRQWLVMAVVLTGTFMTILDSAVVNVAIPSIRSDLHATFAAIEMVLTVYTLSYACLLITGGRLGDLYGRKRMFIVGLIIFGLASAACGLAPDIWTLVGARAVQGVGAAILYPQVLAIIQITFDEQERGKALAMFGLVIGVASITGQIIGGLLLSLDIAGLGWRPIFLINIPLAMAGLAAACIVLERDEPDRSMSLDAGGVALASVTLALMVIPLLLGRELDWPWWLMLCLLASAPMLAMFVWYERWFSRKGGMPLVPMHLFADRSFVIGIPISILFIAPSTSGFLLAFTLYFQIGLGFSPFDTALTSMPVAAAFLVGSLTAPLLVPILGRYVLASGYAIAAIGLAGMAITAVAAGTHVSGLELAPSMVIFGLGQGLGLTPLIGRVIAALGPHDAGAAAGVVGSTLKLGSALGVAVTNLVFFAVLGHARPGADYPHSFAATLIAGAAMLMTAAYLVRRLPRRPKEVGNALLERAPSWGAGMAYSMFLMTGGYMAGGLFREILGRANRRSLVRTHRAPLPPGQFLAFHFHEAQADDAWQRYLMREALTYGTRHVPHETQRMHILQAQVDETRQRQELGLLPRDLDPALLRLFVFCLTNYPRLQPQITRMITGMTPDDPAFVEAWEKMLHQVGDLLEQAASRSAAVT